MSTELKQNTQEWLDIRKEYIGASDAPVIMEVNKFKMNDGRIKTPHLLWQEKLGIVENITDNARTRFGKENESVALSEYCRMKGERFESEVLFHPSIPYLMASLDGINKEKTKAVEIKNAGEADHECARNGNVPEHYYPQLQHQIEVSGLDYIDYFSYNKGEGIIVSVKRDDSYIKKMLKKEAAFYDCMKNFSPPDLTEKDYVERSAEWSDKAKELFSIKQQIKDLSSVEKDLEKELRAISDDQNSCADGYFYTFSLVKGTVNYATIPELQGVDLELYRKPCSKRWTLKKQK